MCEERDVGLVFPMNMVWLVLPGVLPLTAVWMSSLSPVIRSTTTIVTASVLTVGWIALPVMARVQRWGVRCSPTDLVIRGLRSSRIAWADAADVESVQRWGQSRVGITKTCGRREWLLAPVGSGWTHPEYDAHMDDLISCWRSHHGDTWIDGPGYPWPRRRPHPASGRRRQIPDHCPTYLTASSRARPWFEGCGRRRGGG